MNWTFQAFGELSPTDLYAILKLRSRVFVVEQQCCYLDIDGQDALAYHLYGRDEQKQLVAYCRIFPKGATRTACCSIGRVVCDPQMRGKGYGRALMQKALAHIRHHWPGTPVAISAQLYLEAFYASLGFEALGAPYPEDGISHIRMLRQPD